MNKAQINMHQRVIYKVRTNRIVPVALLHGVSEHVTMGADLEEAVLRRAEWVKPPQMALKSRRVSEYER